MIVNFIIVTLASRSDSQDSYNNDSEDNGSNCDNDNCDEDNNKDVISWWWQ